MTINRDRFLSFDPAVKKVQDYLGNAENKASILKQIDYMISGVWGYIHPGQYKHLKEFKKALTNADTLYSQLELTINFFKQHKSSATLFIKELIVHLFPQDADLAKHEKILEQSCNAFMQMAEETIKSHNDEVKAKQVAELLMKAEENALAEKKLQDFQQRSQLISETSTIAARTLSMKTFSKNIEEERQQKFKYKSDNIQKIEKSDNQLNSARNSMGSFFEQRFQLANPNNLSPDELKAEQNAKLKEKLEKHKEQVKIKKQAKLAAEPPKQKMSMTLFIEKHKKQLAEKKRLAELLKDAPTKFTPDPFHRKPMP